MKTLSAGLLSHYALGTTHLATCWKTTRVDGTVFAATSHGEDIILDGVTYSSIASYLMTDQQSGAELAPDNFELEGFLASPSITLADIHAGVWDAAVIEMFEVNFADLTQGRNLLMTGTLGEIKAARSKFNVEARGLTQKLTRRIVRLMNKECDADLGDARCTINLASFTASGTVTAVNERNGIVAAVFGTQATHYYTGGLVTFTSGLNDGLAMEIMTHSNPDTWALLHQQMPYTVAIGDTFTVSAGCAKRYEEDCIGKFNNGVNFRGYPHLPGTDIYKGPQR